MNEKAPSHEHAVNLFYTCMRIARRVQPADISEVSLNFQVPRNNNIIIKAVKHIVVFNFQSIMFDNIFC